MSSNHSRVRFQDTGYFSKLMQDYLSEAENLRPYYENFPNLEGYQKQLKLRESSFGPEKRTVLVEALKSQYQGLDLSESTAENLDLLGQENSFTVTTGHQLNLFTGPLYFLYKIMTVINICARLKEEHPDRNFIPVYWMATEDHDFEEICFFRYKGKKIQWDSGQSGAVGRMTLDGLDEVYHAFEALLGQHRHAEELRSLFRQAYLEQKNLTSATRFLANALMGTYGLVIIDGDDHALKSLFGGQVKNELKRMTCVEQVSQTNAKLGSEYKIQVNPREINLFYLDEGLRERIVYEQGQYKVLNTDLSFSYEEMEGLVEQSPEKFSPNVLMRPLYQECILPNLAYIGGGGEMAYWLQLKSFFEAAGTVFPILHLRNSVLVRTQKQAEKIRKLGIDDPRFFMKWPDLSAAFVKEISSLPIDFSEQKQMLENMFKAMEEVAKKTDASFLGAVKAQQRKQEKGLAHLEKRLLRAQKRVYKDKLERLEVLKTELFPAGSLQERYCNFSEFYEGYGKAFIEEVKEQLDPFAHEFDLIDL